MTISSNQFSVYFLDLYLIYYQFYKLNPRKIVLNRMERHMVEAEWGAVSVSHGCPPIIAPRVSFDTFFKLCLKIHKKLIKYQKNTPKIATNS